MNQEMALATLAPHRRDAVLAWLNSSVGKCVSCEQAVTYGQAKVTGKEGMRHVACPDAASQSDDADDAVSLAVAARARRSDWG